MTLKSWLVMSRGITDMNMYRRSLPGSEQTKEQDTDKTGVHSSSYSAGRAQDLCDPACRKMQRIYTISQNRRAGLCQCPSRHKLPSLIFSVQKKLEMCREASALLRGQVSRISTGRWCRPQRSPIFGSPGNKSVTVTVSVLGPTVTVWEKVHQICWLSSKSTSDQVLFRSAAVLESRIITYPNGPDGASRNEICSVVSAQGFC